MSQAHEFDRLESASASGDTPPEEILDRALALYEETPEDSEEAARVRALFVRHLDAAVLDAPESDRYRRFLAEHVESADFASLEFEEPERAMRLFELLYRVRYSHEAHASRVREHTEELLRSTLQRYEDQGDLEDMFQLLQIAPSHDLSDPEVVRLRSRAHLYESRKARRRRRFLYGYLLLQAALILVVFPLLFINAENGRLQREIEEAVDVDVEAETARQSLRYRDAVYWSVITASSIGYGDITPRTAIGRGIAATLGTFGVITVGVIAGLILSWITPRRLD